MKALSNILLYKNFVIWIVALLLKTNLSSADSIRTDFAQSYLSFGNQWLPSVHLGDGSSLPERSINRISWGGLHFWRHIDFEISIPLNGQTRSQGNMNSFFESGSTYGFSTSIYPWSLEPNSIRPFVGVGFLSGLIFQYGSSLEDSPVFSKPIHPFKAGLSFRYQDLILELGYQNSPINNFQYYTSRSTQTNVRFSSSTVYLNTKYIFDTTKNAQNSSAIKSGAFTIALGPSSSYALGTFDYNTTNRPWIGNRPFQTDLMPEFGLGYFFFNPNVQINVAYKNAESTLAGYSLKQDFQRESKTIEIHKYLFDLYGFVPFLGVNINFDRFSFRETDFGVKTIDDQNYLVAPGITFGWDIKPVKKMKMVLRTNLRWTFPKDRLFSGLAYEMPSNQFEFNYIQLVWFI